MFSTGELQIVAKVVAEDRGLSRTQLMVRVCERLRWRRPNGALKVRELSGPAAEHGARRLGESAAETQWGPAAGRVHAGAVHAAGGAGGRRYWARSGSSAR